MQFTKTINTSVLFLLLIFAISMPAQTTVANPIAGSGTGFVYVMTNQSAGNTVIQFQRAVSGELAMVNQAATQGVGSGGTHDPLASQNALVLSGDGQLLVAANAGSNEISVLRAGTGGVQFLSKVASGGTFPSSIAMNGSLVYVLNARGTPNISGFRLAVDGTLTAIPNSTHNLPGGAGAAPADVRFSQDGTLLLVTETATNQIDVFQVQNDGSATDGVAMAASGKTPFGIAFATRDRVLVTEAGSASVSSYNLNDSNGLETISASVPNHGLASCWITLTNDKTFAYVSNTGSANISSYQVDQHGNLTLAKAVAGPTENATSSPIDSAMSDDSRFLYVLESTLGKIIVFSANGANLTRVATIGGLPTSVQGIAAQ
jgi:6-phosphogluconolactonase (cycloisomerase 2 family)